MKNIDDVATDVGVVVVTPVASVVLNDDVKSDWSVRNESTKSSIKTTDKPSKLLSNHSSVLVGSHCLYILLLLNFMVYVIFIT